MAVIAAPTTPLTPPTKKESKAPMGLKKCLIVSLLLNVALLLQEFLLQDIAVGETQVASVSSKCSTDELNGYENISKTTTSSSTQPQGFLHNDVIFAHIHMAKTAGTEINGELAAHYERVCGHKGYSYDSYEFNKRNAEWVRKNPDTPLSDRNGPVDSVAEIDHNRGRVPPVLMRERGFQDCDWISIEEKFQNWRDVLQQVSPHPVEFHVPCRDPVDLLMSMNNFYLTVMGITDRAFQCNITDDQIPAQVNKGLVKMERFKGYNEMQKDFGTEVASRITYKCFEPFPIENYNNYMGTKLQPKRMQRAHIHRDTNKPRDKAAECLRQDPVLMEKVRKYMEESLPYFRFCKSCLGSDNDLLASSATR